jgi:hypothetical protein
MVLSSTEINTKMALNKGIPDYYETNWGLEKGILRRAEGSRLCSLWI